MKRVALRLEMLLILAFVTTRASGEDPQPPRDVAKPAFEQLVVDIEPFGSPYNAQVEQLRIEATGRCWYKVEGYKATQNIPDRNGAVFDHTPSQDRIRRLNTLLEDTQWLTAAGADGKPHRHPTTVRLMLKRGGAQRSVVCEGELPKPYAALLHELYGIAVQERRIYQHDYLPSRAEPDAWQEIGREMAALRGESYAKSLFDFEYERYLPIARRIIRDFHNKQEDELIPAIRLAGYLKSKPELSFLHRMADDRSMRVRKEIAQALGMIHDKESLPVLVSMMPAAGTGREVGFELIKWGNDAVPDIVKLIEQSTNEREIFESRERTTGENMIRAYLDNWAKVEKPIEPDVVAAVRKALDAKDPKNGLIRTTYHVEFLKLIPMN